MYFYVHACHQLVVDFLCGLVVYNIGVQAGNVVQSELHQRILLVLVEDVRVWHCFFGWFMFRRRWLSSIFVIAGNRLIYYRTGHCHTAFLRTAYQPIFFDWTVLALSRLQRGTHNRTDSHIVLLS